MAMISTLIWGGRKTGATITGCTHDRAERQVMDRIVETGGRHCLVADSRIGCSRQKATPTGMPSGNRWAAAWHAPVLDFRIDLLSPGRHGEIGFGNGKGGGGRKLGLKLRHAGSCEKAWLAGVGTGTVAGWRGGWSDETGNGKFRNESRWHQKVAHIRRQLRFYWKIREDGHLGSYVCLPTMNRRIITFNPEKTSTGFSRYKTPRRSIMTFTCLSNRL